MPPNVKHELSGCCCYLTQLSTGQRLVKSEQQGKSYLQAPFRRSCDSVKEHRQLLMVHTAIEQHLADTIISAIVQQS